MPPEAPKQVIVSPTPRPNSAPIIQVLTDFSGDDDDGRPPTPKTALPRPGASVPPASPAAGDDDDVDDVDSGMGAVGKGRPSKSQPGDKGKRRSDEVVTR
jgi:hypothetical protein